MGSGLPGPRRGHPRGVPARCVPDTREGGEDSLDEGHLTLQRPGDETQRLELLAEGAPMDVERGYALEVARRLEEVVGHCWAARSVAG